MRALLATTIVLLALMPAFPAASAQYGVHYGSNHRGCGPAGIIALPSADCPLGGQSGWVEQAGCVDDLCSLAFWHTGSGHSREPRAMEVRSYISVLGWSRELCSAAGTGQDVRCQIDGEIVAFPKDQGCSPLYLDTIAREQGEIILASRGEAVFNLCREGDDVWFGPSVANDWVGKATSECDPGLIVAGCYLASGGTFGTTDCDANSCDVVGNVWATGSASSQGPKIIRATFASGDAEDDACIGADFASYVLCQGSAGGSIQLSPGECTALFLHATLVDAVGQVVNTLDVPFEACRDATSHRVVFHNV